MAATASLLRFPSPSLSHHRTALSSLLRPSLRLRSNPSARPRSRPPPLLCNAYPPPSSSSPLHALIFDCDGVILESEHLHRQAYNDAFAHFNVRCPPSSSEPLHWGVEFYDELQNRIGGGKPKMRWAGKLKGDDVKEKKPDPSIYLTAAKKLGVSGKNCLVVEDSVIGLQAATGAAMHCIITYTTSTANQDFSAAIATYPDLTNVRLEDLELLLQNSLVAN